MEDKVKKVMSEFKAGELKSSSGKKVTSRKQAAIALAMQQKAKAEEELDQRPASEPFCDYIFITANWWQRFVQCLEIRYPIPIKIVP